MKFKSVQIVRKLDSLKTDTDKYRWLDNLIDEVHNNAIANSVKALPEKEVIEDTKTYIINPVTYPARQFSRGHNKCLDQAKQSINNLRRYR